MVQHPLYMRSSYLLNVCALLGPTEIMPALALTSSQTLSRYFFAFSGSSSQHVAALNSPTSRESAEILCIRDTTQSILLSKSTYRLNIETSLHIRSILMKTRFFGMSVTGMEVHRVSRTLQVLRRRNIR